MFVSVSVGLQMESFEIEEGVVSDNVSFHPHNSAQANS